MLDFKDTDLARREIQAARNLTRRQISNFERQQKYYTGPYWQTTEGLQAFGADEGQDSQDGTHFEFVALMMARLAFRVPRVSVTSSRAGAQEEIAVATKHALNRVIRDSNYRHTQRQSALDFLFNFSVMHLSRVESPLYGGEESEINPMWPEANRISQKAYFRDPMALDDMGLVRYEGHDTFLDKEDLIRIAEEENKKERNAKLHWDLEAIDAAPEGSFDDDGKVDVPSRKQVCLTTVWVRGYEDKDHPGTDKGYNGTVFYYASGPEEGDDAMLLVKQEPFYGPPWGPYYVGTAYSVPDAPLGLSPLTAAETQIREQQRHAKAVGDSAASFKKLLFVDSPDNTLGQRVANSPHLHVHNVAGLERNRMVEATFGGADTQSVQYLQLCRDRVDRMLGISEAMRGVATGQATATETALAGQAGGVRMAWIQGSFIELHERLFRGMAWYLYHDNEVAIPLSREAAEELGTNPEIGLVYRGGDEDRESGFAWADLELNIELRSTEHESDEAKLVKVQTGGQLLMNVAQLAPAAPWVDWEAVIRIQGEALGLPRLHELWDEDIYQEFVARQLQMEAASGAGADPESRFDSQVKAAADRRLQSNVKARPFDMSQMMGGGGMPGEQSGAQAAAPLRSGPAGYGGSAGGAGGTGGA